MASTELPSLCTACQNFKLSLEAFSSAPFEERRVHQLGQVPEIQARTCPLCQLVVQAYQNGPVDPAILPTSRIQGSWTEIGDGSRDACLVFWLISSNYDTKVELSVRLIEPGGGRLINSEWIDTKLVRAWMELCETKHECMSVPLEATRMRVLPEGFMVIDVIGNCLVEPDPSCRFVALSYVWGTSIQFKTLSKNIVELHQANALERVWDRLSPTIKDAIQFTRRLGERYIWIDSLCIQQDSAANSKTNIDAMDSIYRHATLVLCAADDTAPIEGLPGVSSRSRIARQFTAEIIPGVRVLARFGHVAHMNLTKYQTRAWTYQEVLLSTREVIFTNSQVYFACPNYVYAEDVQAENREKPDRSLVVQHKMARYIHEDALASMMYFESVQAYTIRQLTYPSDILNAFRGVEAMQNQRFGSRAICGLQASIFDIALLWQPNTRTSRRAGFPSWSWAGWYGGVRWNGDTNELASIESNATTEASVLTKWLRRNTWIVWHHKPPGGSLQPVWQYSETQHTEKIFWPASGYQDASRIGYDAETATPNNLFGRKISFKSIISNYQSQGSQSFASAERLQSIPEDISPLVFYTLVVKFRIVSSTAYLRYGSVDPVWVPNGRVVFLLGNKHNQTSGYVLLDESWNDKSIETEHDFLMLSEANFSCQYMRPHFINPYRSPYDNHEGYDEFHIMMVQWKTLEDGTRVAERVGIGRLLQEAVGDACGEGALWKEIVLV